MLTEVCVASVAGARAADLGGGDRIELATALELGGLTPSAGLIESCVDILPTHVLIRPRPGDFSWDARELRVMAKDIEHAIDKGAVAVVLGALTPAGEVDVGAMHRLLGAAADVPVTFHRAFDSVTDPFRSLDELLELGVDRLLTSGCADRAVDGITMIAELVRRAGDDLVVMAGSGVDPGNAVRIVQATGVRELHSSARQRVENRPTTRIRTGLADDRERWETSAEIVRLIVGAVAGLP